MLLVKTEASPSNPFTRHRFTGAEVQGWKRIREWLWRDRMTWL